MFLLISYCFDFNFQYEILREQSRDIFLRIAYSFDLKKISPTFRRKLVCLNMTIFFLISSSTWRSKYCFIISSDLSDWITHQTLYINDLLILLIRFPFCCRAKKGEHVFAPDSEWPEWQHFPAILHIFYFKYLNENWWYGPRNIKKALQTKKKNFQKDFKFFVLEFSKQNVLD